MKLWLDAQLPPALADWINDQGLDVQATPVRELGLRDALDQQIFDQARRAKALVMTKDRDFITLLDQYGPPPQVIWLRIGNSSNQNLRAALTITLSAALEQLRSGAAWVEVRPR
jgi:predicted nuclease of predicted toxin-antitoxin system